MGDYLNAEESNMWHYIHRLERSVTLLQLRLDKLEEGVLSPSARPTGAAGSNPPDPAAPSLFPPTDADIAYSQQIREAANRADVLLIKEKNTAANAGVTPALALAMQLRHYGRKNF